MADEEQPNAENKSRKYVTDDGLFKVTEKKDGSMRYKFIGQDEIFKDKFVFEKNGKGEYGISFLGDDYGLCWYKISLDIKGNDKKGYTVKYCNDLNNLPLDNDYPYEIAEVFDDIMSRLPIDDKEKEYLKYAMARGATANEMAANNKNKAQWTKIEDMNTALAQNISSKEIYAHAENVGVDTNSQQVAEASMNDKLDKVSAARANKTVSQSPQDKEQNASKTVTQSPQNNDHDAELREQGENIIKGIALIKALYKSFTNTK